MADTTVLEDMYSNDTPLYWVFGILPTASAFPALVLVPPKVTHDRIVVIVTLAIFALIGVLFLWAAIHATIRVRKFGPTTCHLDRPIHAGGQIHGEMRTRMPALPRDGFLFDVSCTHQTGRGNLATSGDLWTTRQRVLADGIEPNPEGIRVRSRSKFRRVQCRPERNRPTRMVYRSASTGR